MENPALPGLAVSPDDEKPDTSLKNGKLNFRHQQLSNILDGLSQGLKQPVLDQTGLTQFYNFSVAWNAEIQQRMQSGSFDLDGVKQVLSGWGLRLESDTVPLEMYVVARAH